MANLNILDLVTADDISKVRDALAQNIVSMQVMNDADVFKAGVAPFEKELNDLLEEQKGLTNELAKRAWEGKIKEANTIVEKLHRTYKFNNLDIETRKLALAKCNELLAKSKQ